MKKLHLYLFVFSALINLFTYMYFTKKGAAETERLKKIEQKIETKNAIIDSLETQIFEISHYSLKGNYAAQDYVEEYFENHDIQKVKDSILNLNFDKNGNALVGYPDPNNRMIISRAEFLNHRWILADFDNQNTGGQILIRYYLNPDGTFSMETIDRAFYLPKIQRAE